MFRLGIVLQTAGRPNLTEMTAKSFREHTPDLASLPFRVHLLWAGDGEKDNQNELISRQYGFRSLYNGETPAVGPFESRKRIIRMTEGFKFHYIMVLENDFEFVRPLPWKDINVMLHEPYVGCFRLQGIYKEKDKQRPCGTHRQYFNGSRKKIKWYPVPDTEEKCQSGKAHWGGPPSIISYHILKIIHDNALDDEQAMKVSSSIPFLTVRVLNNVCYHVDNGQTSRLIVDGKDMHKIRNQKDQVHAKGQEKSIQAGKARQEKSLEPRILSTLNRERRTILALPKVKAPV